MNARTREGEKRACIPPRDLKSGEKSSERRCFAFKMTGEKRDEERERERSDRPEQTSAE